MIQHIKCNIFESGADVILHQVNCQGVMGSGVAKQVKERYPNVFWGYKLVCDWCKDKSELLGIAEAYQTKDNIIVNLHAQENYGYDGKCYTDYDALKRCLIEVADHIATEHDTIAIPYLMGCHRGGGDWNKVYGMIEEVLGDYNVLICEYNGG